MKRTSSEAPSCSLYHLSNTPSKKNQLQKIRNDLLLYPKKNISFNQPFYQEYHKNTLFLCKINKAFLEQSKKFTCSNYSFLGLAIISIKKLPYPLEEPSFLQKRIFIQELITLGFVPTQEDKKLAEIEKRERCKPMVQKISFFRYAYCASEIFSELPPELIDCISLLMFETEESLL